MSASIKINCPKCGTPLKEESSFLSGTLLRKLPEKLNPSGGIVRGGQHRLKCPNCGYEKLIQVR